MAFVVQLELPKWFMGEFAWDIEYGLWKQLCELGSASMIVS